MLNKQKRTFQIDHTHPQVLEHLSRHLYDLLAEPFLNRPILLVCIGTDRSTGDALGPLVGSRLMSQSMESVYTVFGTLDHPVHAVNLKETMDHIAREYEHPFIVAVDACLGQLSSVGQITIGKGPLKPGAGVNKDLPEVGDIHITGIVNVGGFMEYFVLQNTRLSLVMRMSECISQALITALGKLAETSSLRFTTIHPFLPRVNTPL